MALPAHIGVLDELDAAWRRGPAGERLEAVRRAALTLRARLRAGKTARAVRTYDLITLPYPARYGLSEAVRTPWPFLMMCNRMQVVTFDSSDGKKCLLVNPSDHERNAATPFFARLKGLVPAWADALLARRHGDVPQRLSEAGLRGEDVDYVTYDHLHTQDVRRVLGEWCPRAKLLVQRAELDVFAGLHPLQRDWYVADGLRGVAPERIVVLERDVSLGDGVAIVRTPGHTVGNHSIVLHTDRGLWAISENGVSCDNYLPERSALRGLAKHARATGVEVVLNGNTREQSLEQYTSMVLEKTLADACPDGSGFVQHFPSSEMVAHPLLPGLRPTYSHHAITHGGPIRI